MVGQPVVTGPPEGREAATTIAQLFNGYGRRLVGQAQPGAENTILVPANMILLLWNIGAVVPGINRHL